VVVYKVDRLSRSLLDFARMLSIFEKHEVSFSAVTQNFNSHTPMGKLTLNILLSFAQFERELIAERTSDKIAASRKRGKWGGGPPILGYNVVREVGGPRIVVNKKEARRVQQIFHMYLETGSIVATLKRLDELGWMTKFYKTKHGHPRGGRPFDNGTLRRVLRNVTYIGMIGYRGEAYEGEHEGIVDPDLFHQVQRQLNNSAANHTRRRSKYKHLLQGLVRCKHCGSGMTSSAVEKNGRRYRYYVCLKAQKRGWHLCPCPSLPAGELEQFVIDHIRSLGQDGSLVLETIEAAQNKIREQIDNLKAQRRRAEKSIVDANKDIAEMAGKNPSPEDLACAQQQLDDAEDEITKTDKKLDQLDNRLIDEDELVGALESFEPVWKMLSMDEQRRVIRLLVRQVEYDAEQDSVVVTFHTSNSEQLEQQEALA
jgi:site-specific DNA recombinase